MVLLVEFLPSLTITALNGIVPLIFGIVVKAENYTPEGTIKITLIRYLTLMIVTLISYFMHSFHYIYFTSFCTLENSYTNRHYTASGYIYTLVPYDFPPLSILLKNTWFKIKMPQSNIWSIFNETIFIKCGNVSSFFSRQIQRSVGKNKTKIFS